MTTKIRYCENCGKELTEVYASGRFCSKRCACTFAGKKSYEKAIENKEDFLKRLEKARSSRTFESIKKFNPSSCSFCGKLCKNDNSLRNHERLCSKNPNRQKTTFANKEIMSKLDRKSMMTSTKKLFCCSFCGKEWQTTKTGYKTHELHCHSNPNRIPGSWAGRQHSEDQKKKISEASKKAHDEGRGHTWQNRYLNPSYAEQWLYGILEKRNISFEKEKPFKGFFLDVVIGNKVIEIDGEQHYDKEKFPEQRDRDNRKDRLLAEEGFSELRLRWSEVRKNPELYIDKILDFLK